MTINTDGRLPRALDLDSAAHRHAATTLVLPPAAGEISSPFAPRQLVRSQHPALQRGNAGGHDENVARAIAEAAGGKLTSG
jgi:hypothetical protein